MRRALVPLAALALAACGSPKAPEPWFYLAEAEDGPVCAPAEAEMVADIPADRRHYIRGGVILLRGESACEATADLHRRATYR